MYLLLKKEVCVVVDLQCCVGSGRVVSVAYSPTRFAIPSPHTLRLSVLGRAHSSYHTLFCAVLCCVVLCRDDMNSPYIHSP